ncbi:protein root UVB sensitive 5 isoform X2 [Mercurialis annua]|uniref:protein root UVB sensitive 5 isoform X2 n=1 Tax=Mercurialis annua TaxID=3986 RepID=UPI00215FC344|nr:protein root UVB sensitive 5 isoform X2 [Mercurialis annua]
MCSSLHLSFPAASPAFESSSRNRKCRRLQRILCFPLQSSTVEDGENEANNNNCRNAILVERYGNGTSRRYVLDDDSQLKSFPEEKDDIKRESHMSDVTLSWLPYTVKDFILPAGFPDDYLQYMLLQFPTNITGWICHTLVTSSLLKAVGVGSFTGSTAAASAAAIRWVSKDGIGALGRLFIGGRFGSLFDGDPKQWRMYADFIGSAGSIFDLITQVYPTYFLPLASLGNLTKAVARGLKDPSSRVIQNHFAISGNMGEVAAKEEVWEVGAQWFGLALGILILDTPGIVKSFPTLGLTWMSMRLLHLWLRYLSLSVLKFDTINLKRARLLVKSHVLRSSVLGCVDCNREENILSLETFTKPRITFCVPLEEMIGSERSVAQVKILVKLYKKEKYFLVVNRRKKDFEVFVSFKVGATSMSVLRSVWQTYWLHENWGSSTNASDQLAQSLREMEVGFEDFMQQLKLAGWNTRQINLKVPREISIDEIDSF